MQAKKTELAKLLPYGGISSIAKKLGISRQAVSDALAAGRPGNRVVIEALRMAKESGSLEAAQSLASLQPSA
ncbi:hypothetical protein GCM10023185_30030 [Hymenobacter saemangeumensis]|uniref:DNA-binding protein n=1 Tax=Hymenobacter saemangeumensis TaxID=1084522 RepID=A0ABP8ILA3_9BACT